MEIRLSRVWVPTYELMAYYGDDSNVNHTKLYYQIKRWKSWMKKERRKELNKQIGDLSNAQKDEIVEFGRLLDELEL